MMAAYHFTITLRELFPQVVQRMRRALEDHDFRIVEEIDLSAVMREKLGAGGLPHLILEAIARSREESSLLTLPCRIVIRSTDRNGVVVDLMDPVISLDAICGVRVVDLTDDLSRRYEMVRRAVAREPVSV